MGNEGDDTVETVVGEILDYLKRCPNAVDTAKGVCAWWLKDARGQAVVQSALDALVEDGSVRRIEVLGGQWVYGLRDRRMAGEGDPGSGASAAGSNEGTN